MGNNWKNLYQLLNKYLSGKATASEKVWIDTWYESLANKPEITDEEKINQEMWANIEAGMESDSKIVQTQPVSRFWGLPTKLIAAACIIISSAFILYGYIKIDAHLNQGITESIPKHFIVFQNDTKSTKSLILSDSSEIVLEPGASVYYPQYFQDTLRKVYLSGNAFFEITPNKKKPFVVQTETIATRVLGTSFTIVEDFEKKQVEVSVVTGKVEVSSTENEMRQSKLIVTANKKATYLLKDKTLTPSIVDEPKQITSHSENLIELPTYQYKETQLSEILNELSNAYGVKIELEDKKLEQYLINADLSQDDNLFAKLDLLCAALNLTYETKLDRVYLNRIISKNHNK